MLRDLSLPLAIVALTALLSYWGVQAYRLYDLRIAEEIARAAVRR